MESKGGALSGTDTKKSSATMTAIVSTRCITVILLV